MRIKLGLMMGLTLVSLAATADIRVGERFTSGSGIRMSLKELGNCEPNAVTVIGLDGAMMTTAASIDDYEIELASLTCDQRNLIARNARIISGAVVGYAGYACAAAPWTIVALVVINQIIIQELVVEIENLPCEESEAEKTKQKQESLMLFCEWMNQKGVACDPRQLR